MDKDIDIDTDIDVDIDIYTYIYINKDILTIDMLPWRDLQEAMFLSIKPR